MFKIKKNIRKSNLRIIIFFHFCLFCFLALFIPITIFFVNKPFSFKKEQEYIKTFDASYLNRYYSGKFTLKFTKKNDCELLETKNFKVNTNWQNHKTNFFNLGNGQFRDKNNFYTIQTIGKNAFKDNKDISQHLIVPSVIKKIDDGAFANTKIETIYIKNKTNFLPINENVFTGCNIKKIVTRNAAYKNDPNWIKICRNSKNIVCKPYTLGDYEKFLSLRTFSIGLFCFIDNPKENKILLGKHYSGGTGWIVDKVDHKNDNDYKYWMATNLHVSNVFDPLYDENISKKYKNNCHIFCACTCNDIAGNEILIDEPQLRIKEEKKTFYSTKWKQVAIETKDSNKIYNANLDLDYHKDLVHKHRFTDFSLIKIDFMLDLNDEITKKLKTKLEKINKHLLFNNSLNVYMPNIAKNSTKIYGIGYPAKISNGILLQNKIEYIFQKGKVIDYFKSNETHCDFYIVKEWIDNPDDKWLLTRGASGTMMIDENFSTIGIFWGSDGNTKEQTDNIYQDSLMFVDRFYVNGDNLVAKFLEI